jgi:hypothetical protein
MGVEELRDALAKSKRAKLDAIVQESLSCDTLKDICGAVGLDDTGKENAALVEGILAAGGDEAERGAGYRIDPAAVRGSKAADGGGALGALLSGLDVVLTNQRDLQLYDLARDREAPRLAIRIDDLPKYSEAFPFFTKEWTPGAVPRIVNVEKVSADVAHPLKDAQAALDAAVADAYGMPPDQGPTEFLLELNQLVAEDEEQGRKVCGPGLPDHRDPKDPRWFSIDCIEPPPVES